MKQSRVWRSCRITLCACNLCYISAVSFVLLCFFFVFSSGGTWSELLFPQSYFSCFSSLVLLTTNCPYPTPPALPTPTTQGTLSYASFWNFILSCLALQFDRSVEREIKRQREKSRLLYTLIYSYGTTRELWKD